MAEVEARIEVCSTNRLVNLRKFSPELRHQHLRERLDSTIKKSDEKVINAIKRIVQTEAICRR